MTTTPVPPKDAFTTITYVRACSLLEQPAIVDGPLVVFNSGWEHDDTYDCDYQKVVFANQGRFWMLSAEKENDIVSFFNYELNEWDDVGDQHDVVCLEVIRTLVENEVEIDEDVK
jgi:hypothetical protein